MLQTRYDTTCLEAWRKQPMSEHDATLWTEIATWSATLAEAEGVTPHTARAYRHAALRFATWLHAQRRAAGHAADITGEDAIRYRETLVAEGVPAGTLNRHVTALRLFIDRAVPTGPNPFRQISLAPRPHPRPSTESPPQPT
jgi:site-specific recombinase XerD